MRLLNKANLLAARFASKDATRYNLAGLHVTETRVEATDGHALITVALPEIDPKDAPAHFGNPDALRLPVIVPAETISAALKALPKRPVNPIMAHASLTTDEKGGEVTITTGCPSEQSIARALATEGSFPQIDLVIPKDEPQHTEYFSVALLARVFSDLAAVLGTRPKAQTVVVKVDLFKQGTPLRITAKTASGQDVCVVVMPCRGPKTEA